MKVKKGAFVHTSKMEANARIALLSILLALINSQRGNVFSQVLNRPGRLIFEENFDSATLDKSRWSREIKIPGDPEYEFCVYHKHEETVQISDGTLIIKPRLFEDAYGEDSVYVGHLRLASCSSSIPQECNHQASSFHIIPPVISAKLITRNHFEFRYGTIELRAKFPEGDWLYPEIFLEPLYKSVDARYANARIILGRARGNYALTQIGDSREDYGGRLLEFGVANGTASDFQEVLVSRTRNVVESWSKDFHVYKTTWTDKGFTFYVDNELVGTLVPTEHGWSKEGKATRSIVPFNDKFYLSIGLGVGGIRVFPDETQTESYVKPWRNVNAKAMLRFWQAKDKWLPTWQRDEGAKTALEIDYIRIWSLD